MIIFKTSCNVWGTVTKICKHAKIIQVVPPQTSDPVHQRIHDAIKTTAMPRNGIVLQSKVYSITWVRTTNIPVFVLGSDVVSTVQFFDTEDFLLL